MSDLYDDVELYYPDAKVASMLCPQGPCSYHIKPNSPVSEEWILEHVVLNIARKSGFELAAIKILGKALLYVTFSDHSNWVPPCIRD